MATTATAEQLRVTKEIDEKYTAQIQIADKAFDAAKWEEATTAYKGALQVIPQDVYALGQLQLIEKSVAAAKEKARLTQN